MQRTQSSSYLYSNNFTLNYSTKATTRLLFVPTHRHFQRRLFTGFLAVGKLSLLFILIHESEELPLWPSIFGEVCLRYTVGRISQIFPFLSNGQTMQWRHYIHITWNGESLEMKTNKHKHTYTSPPHIYDNLSKTRDPIEKGKWGMLKTLARRSLYEQNTIGILNLS